MAIFSKLHRNCIVTGYIDCYCLVCSTHLMCEKDALNHTSFNSHLKNLETTSYVTKYEDDYIRKIKKIYFCECCNLILSTLAKVGLHTKESNHTANKTNFILQREDSTIIAFGNLTINEKAWNGFIDVTCNVCNEEFDDENIHKAEETHMVNLVQSKIEFGPEKSIFRKIDDQTMQCLTCNEVLGAVTVNTHCYTAAHKKKYADCKKPDKNINATKKVSTNQPLFKSGFLNLDNNTKKPAAPAKPTEKTIATEKTLKTETTNKPEVQKNYVDIDEDICKKLNANNYITDDETGNKWCILCDWSMDSPDVPVHLCSSHHNNMLKFHKLRLERKNKLQAASVNAAATKDAKPQNVQVKVDSVGNSKGGSDASGLILDSLERYQQSDINVNFVSNTAICRKCNKNIDFNNKSIDDHIQEHKKKDLEAFVEERMAKEKVEVGFKKETKPAVDKPVKAKKFQPAPKPKPIDKAAEKFANDNDLSLTSTNMAFCKSCNVTVPFSLKNMEEHVKGFQHRHRRTNETRGKAKAVTKVPCKQFVDHIFMAKHGPFNDAVINEKYVVSLLSLLAMTKFMDYKCYMCDTEFEECKFEEHLWSKPHLEASENLVVITSIADEFIRELRQDVYHCGFCNAVFTWEELDRHLLTWEHREAARSARWRLQEYQPELKKSQDMQEGVQDIFAAMRKAFC